MTRGGEDVLRFIHWHRRDVGFPPSVREIGKELNITHAAAWYRVKWLRREGLVTDEFRKPRSLVLTEKGLQALGLTDDRWPFKKTEDVHAEFGR